MKLTIGRLMLAIGVVAGGLWAYQSLPGLALIGLVFLIPIIVAALVPAGSPRIAIRVGLAGVGLECLMCLAGMVLCPYSSDYFIWIHLLGMAGVSVALAAGVYWARLQLDWAVLILLATIGIVIVAPILMCWDSWPLKLAFWAASPAMNRLADQVAAGSPPAWPVWAGVYRIAGARTFPGGSGILLTIEPDPIGSPGFYRSRPAPPGVRDWLADYSDPNGRWRYEDGD